MSQGAPIVYGWPLALIISSSTLRSCLGCHASAMFSKQYGIIAVDACRCLLLITKLQHESILLGILSACSSKSISSPPLNCSNGPTSSKLKSVCIMLLQVKGRQLCLSIFRRTLGCKALLIISGLQPAAFGLRLNILSPLISLTLT